MGFLVNIEVDSGNKVETHNIPISDDCYRDLVHSKSNSSFNKFLIITDVFDNVFFFNMDKINLFVVTELSEEDEKLLKEGDEESENEDWKDS